jgi:hypothetical protein
MGGGWGGHLHVTVALQNVEKKLVAYRLQIEAKEQ